MRRLHRPVLTVVAATALLLLGGCRKEVVIPTDPLPFPTDANKDLSIQPGDNFWRYCNGAWLDKAVIPAGKQIYGGLRIAGELIKERKAQLLETDPVLSDILASAKAADAREKNKAYVQKLLDMVPDPADPAVTQEDYARLVGKLYRMGVDGLLSVLVDVKDGNMVPLIMPDVYDGLLPEEIETRPGTARNQRFVDLLCEGMGISKDLAVLDPENAGNDVYGACLTLPKEEICQAVKQVIGRMDRDIDDLTKRVKNVASVYLEYAYTKEYVPSGLKERYTAVCERLRTQYRQRILALDWMSDATKTYALEKLDAMSVNVAYPDDWREGIFPTLDQVRACGSLLEKYMLLNGCCDRAYFFDLLGKNFREHLLDLKIAGGSTMTGVGGQYSTRDNAIFIYSGTLLPPMLPDDVTEAYTYAVFAVIGHEMTHGFDSDGARYDKDGNPKNWWTVADQIAFEERQALLVDCYSHFELAPDILPGKYGNGAVTLEENIADLGGVCIALDAYTERLREQGYFGEVLKAQQRKFFESYADIWCCKYGEAYIKSRTESAKPDSHALPQERVNGVVMNMDIWYELYDVTRENQLYLPPERRARIW